MPCRRGRSSPEAATCSCWSTAVTPWDHRSRDEKLAELAGQVEEVRIRGGTAAIAPAVVERVVGLLTPAG